MYQVMLCSPGTVKDIGRRGYIAEPKLDGVRAVLVREKGTLQLVNRKQENILPRYPELQEISRQLPQDCVLDGEIVVYQKRKPSFSLLHKREQSAGQEQITLLSSRYPATFVAFDIIRLGNQDVTPLPLLQRKQLLKENIHEGKHLQRMPFTSNAHRLWKQIQKKKLEGIVLKQKRSSYVMGRSDAWIKLKHLHSATCVIIGYTLNRGKISALALAVYKDKRLTSVGRVEGGFDAEFINGFSPRLAKITIPRLAVDNMRNKEHLRFVQPKYIAEVSYWDLSDGFELRRPAFKGLREDKLLEECVL